MRRFSRRSRRDRHPSEGANSANPSLAGDAASSNRSVRFLPGGGSMTLDRKKKKREIEETKRTETTIVRRSRSSHGREAVGDGDIDEVKIDFEGESFNRSVGGTTNIMLNRS